MRGAGRFDFRGTELDLMVGHNSFHGLFPAQSGLAGAALMGLSSNSQMEPRDGRSTNALFLVVLSPWSDPEVSLFIQHGSQQTSREAQTLSPNSNPI